ncbi:hypothetical protein FHU13_004614 [Methylobacterium sp. R2-1]|nr:hypothetical protein [Methylobacterium sp. R2-1]
MHNGVTPLLLSRGCQRADSRTRAADLPLVRHAALLQRPVPERLDIFGPAAKLYDGLAPPLLLQRNGASAEHVGRLIRSGNAASAGKVLHQ